MNKIEEIFQNVLKKAKIPEKDLEKIRLETGIIKEKLEKAIKKRRIKADVFIGGSLAKGTIMHRDDYDIDIFVRFDEKYKDEEISEILGKLIKADRIHGSRDYFQVRKKNLLFEIIPTIKIKKPEKARNITDLSYFHVSYVLGETEKNKKLVDDIILAKAFCYSSKCYGAESYIRGFSGYGLELLVIYYKGFLNFMKGVIRAKERIVFDSKKYYKNRDEILGSVNEAKLSSPIVFIDPTYRERNALAALSNETFERFKIACAIFLKKPSTSFFEPKKIDKKGFNLVLELETQKQEGDIAGSKLLKFSKFIEREIGRNHEVKNKDFEYTGGKKGTVYFKVKLKKEVIFSGPPTNKLERLLSFKRAHKNVFIKQGKAYAKEKPKSINEIICSGGKVMKDMGITKIKVIKI